MAEREPRVALYSPGMVGLGHVRRNLLIAHALARPLTRPSLLIIAGAHRACSFAAPPGSDFVIVPALQKDGDGQRAPRYLEVPLQDVVALRTKVILAALESFDPDALIVDHLPRGALRELQPALEQIRSRGHTRCILGLRDILEDASTVRREWSAERNQEAIQDYYDAVWIYGDRRVYDPVTEYEFSPQVAARVHFTGYLDARSRIALADGIPDPLASLGLTEDQLVLCLVGGGQDGERLADAVAAAELPANTNLIILAGPYMPADARARLQRRASQSPRMRLLEFAPEPALLIRRAGRVIAMGGYNTIMEVLSLGKRALIVPRVGPRPEQLIRAERLQALGLLDLMHPAHLCPAAVSEWLARDLGPPLRPDEKIDMNGLENVPRLLEQLLSSSPRHGRAHGQIKGEVQHVAI